MSVKNQIKDVPESEVINEKKSSSKSGSFGVNFKNLIDGSVLTKQTLVKYVSFLFYLVLLAVIYIANTYNAEKKVREIEDTKKEIKVLRSEYVTTKSAVMFNSRQSELIKKLEIYGIKESLNPPIKLFYKEDSNYLKLKTNTNNEGN